jgi:hypothetical protein
MVAALKQAKAELEAIAATTRDHRDHAYRAGIARFVADRIVTVCDGRRPVGVPDAPRAFQVLAGQESPVTASLAASS